MNEYMKDKTAVFIKLAILKYSHDMAYKNILQQRYVQFWEIKQTLTM